MRFHFITVVWGANYTDLFLTIAIPTQLSPGNFPSFPYRNESKYLIYTTTEDAALVQNSPSYGALSKLIATEIVPMYDIDGRNKYGIVAECYNRAMLTAQEDDCAVVSLLPDMILADGALSNLAKIAATGKRAVMIAGLSAVKETCVPALLKEFGTEDGQAVSISSRQLVSLSLDHLSPAIDSLFWDSQTFNSSPSQLYWNVPGEGLLSRWFYLTPFMVHPRGRVESFEGSIDDGDWVRLACPDPEDLYVVEDSDEIFQTTVSDLIKTHYPRKSSAMHVARWAAPVSNKYNRRSLRHKIRMHFNDTSQKWAQIEKSSDEVVQTILLLLKFRPVLLLIDWKKSWRTVRERTRWNLRHSRVGEFGVKFLRRLSTRFQGT